MARPSRRIVTEGSGLAVRVPATTRVVTSLLSGVAACGYGSDVSLGDLISVSSSPGGQSAGGEGGKPTAARGDNGGAGDSGVVGNRSGGSPSGGGGNSPAGTGVASDGGASDSGLAGTSMGGNAGASAAAGSESGGQSGMSGAGSGGSGGGTVAFTQVCEGDRIINTNADFAALVSEQCTRITGDVRIESENGEPSPDLILSSLEGLETLSSIGTLLIYGPPTLADLGGLRNLRSVDRDLLIFGTAATTLAPLQNLTFVGIGFNIQANNWITSLDGLQNLQTVGGAVPPETATSNLWITRNERLVTLAPLFSWSPSVVKDFIFIYNNPALPQSEVDAFDAAQVNASCYLKDVPSWSSYICYSNGK